MKITFTCKCGAEHEIRTSVIYKIEKEKPRYELNWSVPNLNLSFENYIVIPENKKTVARLRDVVRKNQYPGPGLYLISGGVNSGKSHLLCALYHELHDNNKHQATFLTARKFVKEMVSALQSNNSSKFSDEIKKFYILIFDGLEFLVGKDRSTSEFMGLISELNANQSIVASYSSSFIGNDDEFDALLSKFEGFELRSPDAKELCLIKDMWEDRKKSRK